MKPATNIEFLKSLKKGDKFKCELALDIMTVRVLGNDPENEVIYLKVRNPYLVFASVEFIRHYSSYNFNNVILLNQ